MGKHDELPQMFPRGWYTLAFWDEVEPGQSVSMRCFDQPVVLSRDEAGAVALRYPSGDELPWPLVEQSGLILAYYDEQGRQPEFTVPEIEQWNEPEWARWVWRSVVIKTQGREVIENVADLAHFLPVHGAAVEEMKVILDGFKATQATVAGGYGEVGQVIHFKTTATYHGPGIQFSAMDGGVIPSVLVNTHVPVDHESIKLSFGVMIPLQGGDANATRQLGDLWIKEVSNGYFQDVAIWEHKRWRDKPMLCDGDGPIAAVRKWYRQFTTEDVSNTDLVWTWEPNERQVEQIEQGRRERAAVAAKRAARRAAREAPQKA